MASRKTSTANQIDSIAVIAIALKRCKTKAEFNQIAAVNTEADLNAAWNTLNLEDQSRIHELCNAQPQVDLQTIADELVNCGSLIEFQAVKAEHGADRIKLAWKLIPVEEQAWIRGICQHEQQASLVEEPKPVNEQPAIPKVEPPHQLIELEPESQPHSKPRTLFSIGDDLERLNELLDDCGDDAQQQELISEWLGQLGNERDKKLDGYCALITEMTARAEGRKAEARRLAELAAADEGRARLLKDRLKFFFEVHNLKTVETARYKLQVQRNGGKAPLILDDSVPVTQLPKQFQRVSIDPDTAAIRAVLEAGEQLSFARLGERGTSMRIK